MNKHVGVRDFEPSLRPPRLVSEALTGFPREGAGVAEGRPGRLGRAARVGFDQGQHSATVITSPLPGLFDVDRIARAAFASVRVDELDGQGVLSSISRFGLIPHDRSFAPLLVALKARIVLGKVREPGSWLHGPCAVLRLLDEASTCEGG